MEVIYIYQVTYPGTYTGPPTVFPHSNLMTTLARRLSLLLLACEQAEFPCEYSNTNVLPSAKNRS